MQTAAAISEGQGPETFRGFYREHYGFVWHVVGRFGVAPAEHGDAVQDTFITAYRRFGGMRGAAPRSWLYGIARRVASNYRRGAGRAARKQSALAQVGAPNLTPAIADALVLLDRFLDGLDDRDRELFVLSEVLGWSGQEIVKATGIEPRIVYARLRLLRSQLALAVPDGMLAALSRVRSDPPQASERGWLALVPMLGDGIAPTVAAGIGSFALAKIAATIAVVGIVAGVAATLPESVPPHRIESGATPRVTTREPIAALDEPIAALPERIAAPDEPTAAPVAIMPADPIAPALVSPRVTTARVPAPVATSAPDTSLARDNARLREVMDALTSDPSRALELATMHAREFPASPQADVRDALRIDALCELGRADQARRETAAFLAAHPGSPAQRRVQRACGAS